MYQKSIFFHDLKIMSGSGQAPDAFLPPSLRAVLVYLLQMPERFLVSADSTLSHGITAMLWVALVLLGYVVIRGLVWPCLRACMSARTQDSPLEAVFEDPNRPVAGRTGAGRGGRGSAQIGSGGVSRRRGSSASASSSESASDE